VWVHRFGWCPGVVVVVNQGPTPERVSEFEASKQTGVVGSVRCPPGAPWGPVGRAQRVYRAGGHVRHILSEFGGSTWSGVAGRVRWPLGAPGGPRVGLNVCIVQGVS